MDNVLASDPSCGSGGRPPELHRTPVGSVLTDGAFCVFEGAKTSVRSASRCSIQRKKRSRERLTAGVARFAGHDNGSQLRQGITHRGEGIGESFQGRGVRVSWYSSG